MIFAAVSLAMHYPQYFLTVGNFTLSGLIIPLLQIIMFGTGSEVSLSELTALLKMPKEIIQIRLTKNRLDFHQFNFIQTESYTGKNSVVEQKNQYVAYFSYEPIIYHAPTSYRKDIKSFILLLIIFITLAHQAGRENALIQALNSTSNNKAFH